MAHRVKIRRFVRQHVASTRTFAAIALFTGFMVIMGATLITFTDPERFPRYGDGLWWSITTITTVGYGDLIPASNAGRIVGAALMFSGIAALAILSGSIAALLMAEDVEEEERHIEHRLDELERLIRELSHEHRAVGSCNDSRSQPPHTKEPELP